MLLLEKFKKYIEYIGLNKTKTSVQRIREPPLEPFIKFSHGMPLVETLRIVNSNNLKIVSNKRHDEMLKNGKFERLEEVYPCWTGTMYAYEGPNKKLGKEIVYIEPYFWGRYIFPVPEEFRGEKNAILVVEHPNFELVKDRKDVVVLPQAGKVDLVSNFPIENGWYTTNKKYAIPVGKKKHKSDPESRYLYRLSDAKVGLVVRNCFKDLGINMRKDINLNINPLVAFGVAVEATPEQVEAALKLLEQFNQKPKKQ